MLNIQGYETGGCAPLAAIDSWMGQSFGRWEGDTFVIEVTGFNDQSWFDRAGNHHSEQRPCSSRSL